MTLKVTGTGALIKKLNDMVKMKEKNLVANRFAIAQALTEQIFTMTPVWSGRAISSMVWSNSGSSSQGLTFNGEYGATSKMALGEEPARPWAEGRARAYLANVDFSLNKSVTLTLGADHWPLINYGRAPNEPNQKPRNTHFAPVVPTALAIVKGAFKDKVKFV